MSTPDLKRIYGFYLDGIKQENAIEQFTRNYLPTSFGEFDDFCYLLGLKNINGVEIDASRIGSIEYSDPKAIIGIKEVYLGDHYEAYSIDEISNYPSFTAEEENAVVKLRDELGLTKEDAPIKWWLCITSR